MHENDSWWWKEKGGGGGGEEEEEEEGGGWQGRELKRKGTREREKGVMWRLREGEKMR